MILLAHFESAHDKAVPIFGYFVIQQTFDRWRICLILHRMLVYLILCQHSLLVRRRQTSGFIEYFVWIRFSFFHCNFFTIPALSEMGLAREPLKNLHSWLADLNLASTTYCFIVYNMPIVLILLLSLAWLTMACCWMQNLATAKYESRCKIKNPELSYLVTGTRSGRWFLPLLPQISN